LAWLCDGVTHWIDGKILWHECLLLKISPFLLTRPSSPGTTVFVMQAKQNNDNFGMSVLACWSFQFVSDIASHSSKLCPFLSRNSARASFSIPYRYSLAKFLISRDRSDFSSHGISRCKRISSLSFWFARGSYPKNEFIRFHRSSFVAAVLCVQISRPVQCSMPETSSF
jgi:hypothetical protein